MINQYSFESSVLLPGISKVTNGAVMEYITMEVNMLTGGIMVDT
jgi:hypothetical protein